MRCAVRVCDSKLLEDQERKVPKKLYLRNNIDINDMVTCISVIDCSVSPKLEMINRSSFTAQKGKPL